MNEACLQLDLTVLWLAGTALDAAIASISAETLSTWTLNRLSSGSEATDGIVFACIEIGDNGPEITRSIEVRQGPGGDDSEWMVVVRGQHKRAKPFDKYAQKAITQLLPHRLAKQVSWRDIAPDAGGTPAIVSNGVTIVSRECLAGFLQALLPITRHAPQCCSNICCGHDDDDFIDVDSVGHTVVKTGTCSCLQHLYTHNAPAIHSK